MSLTLSNCNEITKEKGDSREEIGEDLTVLKFEAHNVSHEHSCGMGVRVGLHLLCLELCHSS